MPVVALDQQTSMTFPKCHDGDELSEDHCVDCVVPLQYYRLTTNVYVPERKYRLTRMIMQKWRSFNHTYVRNKVVSIVRIIAIRRTSFQAAAHQRTGVSEILIY